MPHYTGHDRFDLLFRVTGSFNSTLDFEEVLNRVIDEIIAALHAERGFVMLLDSGGEFVFRVARGLDRQTILDPQANISLGVVRKVVSEGNPILTSDAQEDRRFNARQSIINLGLCSILCVPLSIKSTTFGVVYIDNRSQSGLFTQDDLDLLTAIAANAAIAIENARLYQVAVEKGRMERELQIARQMQMSMLPKDLPQPPGWKFSAAWQPARQVAGDYYDFIPVDDRHLDLVIADVTDKGVPASFFMAISRTILRTCARQYATPLEVINAANRLVCAESTSGYFITLFFARLDLLSGELFYVNAGHPPPLHYLGPQPQSFTLLSRTGIPLGIDAAWVYEQRQVILAQGSLLVCYTDGITEAMDDRQQEFGFDRLKTVVAGQASAGCDAIIAALQRSISAWAGSAGQQDDITMLLARRD